VSYAQRTRPPRTLTDRETAQILKTMGATKAGFRDRLIVSLALGCGLRQSEIVALNVGDVSADGVTPRRTIQLRVFKRAGLDAKPADHRVHVPDATFYLLKKYLKVMWGDQNVEDDLGRPLFVSRIHRRLSMKRVREMFQEWQTKAKLDQPISFHGLRHTAISTVRRQTGDIRVAQRFARHANIATTVRYDHPSDEEVAAAIKDLPA
jgi:integrase/recombinase XerC